MNKFIKNSHILISIIFLLSSSFLLTNAYYLVSFENDNEFITPPPINSGSDTIVTKVINEGDNSRSGIPILVEERSSDSPKLIGVVKAITNRQNPTMSSELIEMIDKEAQSAAVYLKTLNNLRQSVILSNNNNQLENKSNKEKQKRMMMSDDDYLTDDYGFPITKSWSEYSGGTTRFKRRALLPSKYYDIDLDFDYSW